MLIDTHTHIYAEEFKDDLPAVVQRAKDAGITHLFLYWLSANNTKVTVSQ